MSSERLDGVNWDESLGAGCCGEVFEVEGESDSLVVKRFDPMAIDRNFLRAHFARWRAMPPVEGVVELFDYRIEEPPYAVLTERVSGPSLASLDGLGEGDAWEIVRRLADALGHAHKHGVRHGHLHPGNVLLREEPERGRKGAGFRPVVTDFGSGLVGEWHHIDLRENAFWAAPEQLLSGGADWEGGNLERWDVYSFGAIAFWLLHERHPRGLRYLKHRYREIARNPGRPAPIDFDAFLAEVHDTPELSWGRAFGVSRAHEHFREIVDRCLALDPADRPVDMREVRNQFRALDHQFALEEAEARVVKEKRKQRTKLLGARALAACLGASFLLAAHYLIEYLQKTDTFRHQVSELDQVVVSQQARIHHLDERWAETVTDLKTSREAADAFFQRMARGYREGGSGVASLAEDELEKSRDYYLATLEDVGKSEDTALERGRALHSLAHIERKLGNRDRAVARFREAIDLFEKLFDRHRNDGETIRDLHLRLADGYENLGSLVDSPVGRTALESLRHAVRHFDALVLLDPEDREVVTRQAGTSFMLGRAYEAHRAYDEAIAAYSRSADLADGLREKEPGDAEALTELIGKLQFRAAHSLRRAGRIGEAIDAHIAAMETLEELRGVNGFTPIQSIQLASSYLELGEMFASREATDEDLDQLYNEALRLLTPLNGDNPGDVEVATLLCRSLVHLGRLEREAGRWTAGYRLSTRGIETLKTALESHPAHYEGLIALAEGRLRHLEFLDAGDDSAREIALKGVDAAERARRLVEEVDPAAEPAVVGSRDRLSAVFRRYGKVCEQMGETASAARCREHASTLVSALAREDDPLVE